MNIIPKPLVAKELGGVVPFGSKSEIIGDFVETIKIAKEYLSKFKCDKANKIMFNIDKGIASEGYSISCENGDIIVSASSEAGAYYALMTMLQLSHGQNTMAAVSISDEPKYNYRGFMLDVARHFFSVDKVKEVIDNMSRLKMNYFHWHLSDDQGWRVEIKKYPELTSHGSIRKTTPLSLKGYSADHAKSKVPRDTATYGKGYFYTQDELREVVKYAKERHINVYPEIDMPGHLISAISCYPHLSCTGEQLDVSDNWGVMDNIGCCGKEDIYIFVKDIIDELVEIFDCEFFHIGGDEVPKTQWKKCPNCQAKMKELGLKSENELQGHFNNIIAEYLRSKNKRMIGWNEILDASNLDIDVVVQWWTGISNAKELDWLKRGGNVLLTKLGYVYMDHAFGMRPLEKTYSLSASALGITDDANVLGIEAPQWTEYVRDNDKFDLYTYARLATIAEVAWTSEKNKNYEDYEGRLEGLREYFVTLRMRLAPQNIYRGKTVRSLFSKVNKSTVKWRNDPNYELKLAKEQGWK